MRAITHTGLLIKKKRRGAMWRCGCGECNRRGKSRPLLSVGRPTSFASIKGRVEERKSCKENVGWNCQPESPGKSGRCIRRENLRQINDSLKGVGGNRKLPSISKTPRVVLGGATFFLKPQTDSEPMQRRLDCRSITRDALHRAGGESRKELLSKGVSSKDPVYLIMVTHRTPTKRKLPGRHVIHHRR